MADPQSPSETHFRRLLELMELEAEAEKQEELRRLKRLSPAGAEASGSSLINLVIRDQDAGLGGRCLLTFGKRAQNLALPWTRLGTGSPVILTEEGAASSETGDHGVVSRLLRDTIQVAFNDWPETQTDRPVFRLDRSPDEIARQRQRQALDQARGAARGSRLAALRDSLLGLERPVFEPPGETSFFDALLNPAQRQAVRFALTARDVAVIHGPPGTGKTTTLVELIRQILRTGQTVLAVAPSNLAVDNLLERLVAAGENALRLGHPARVLPALQEHTLDVLVENHPDVKLAHKWIRDAYLLRQQASKFTRARPEPGARQAQRQEAKQLQADARRLEDQVVERLLANARVICATTTGLDRGLLGSRRFDWCIFDEASQSSEPAAWIPLQFSDRMVLAGDHCQLPPTVISPEAAVQGLAVSLMERVIALYGEPIAPRLTTQYRMNREIMDFSSSEFYQGSLAAHPSVAQHRLSDLPGVQSNELTTTPVLYIDTAGASYDEEVEPEGESRLNPLEAAQVIGQVQALLAAGLPAAAIGVIAPYSAQVRLLREKLKEPELEIDSVDGFQGREKEAIILSLVRSNPDGEIGFLQELRRMNVALTRARRKLIVIGDSATITRHPFYQRLVAYFESIGAYHSVWEY